VENLTAPRSTSPFSLLELARLQPRARRQLGERPFPVGELDHGGDGGVAARHGHTSLGRPRDEQLGRPHRRRWHLGPRLEQHGEHCGQIERELQQQRSLDLLRRVPLPAPCSRGTVRVSPLPRPRLDHHHRLLVAEQVGEIRNGRVGLGDVLDRKPRDGPRRLPAAEHRGGKQGVEARAPEDRFGTPARHARQRARVLEEVDEALVVEVARQEPPIALHPLGVGEPAGPPLGRGAVRRVRERSDHVVLQRAIAWRGRHGTATGEGPHGRNRTTAVRPSDTIR